LDYDLDRPDCPLHGTASDHGELRVSVEARVRAEVAEEIARAMEAMCPEPDEVHAGDHCDYREAAAAARQHASRP
jgi:hypothetical protein